MRRRIKITNNTVYQTRHLRAFITRVAKQVLDDDKKHYLSVTIDHTRGRAGGSSGRAGINGNWLTVRLSKDPKYVSKVDFASVIAHELGHVIGLRHHQMHNGWWSRGEFNSKMFSWAEDLPLELQPVHHKPRVVGLERSKSQLEHAQKKVKEWESKIKRNQTSLKTWKRKANYYTNRIKKLNQ